MTSSYSRPVIFPSSLASTDSWMPIFIANNPGIPDYLIAEILNDQKENKMKPEYSYNYSYSKKPEPVPPLVNPIVGFDGAALKAARMTELSALADAGELSARQRKKPMTVRERVAAAIKEQEGERLQSPPEKATSKKTKTVSFATAGGGTRKNRKRTKKHKKRGKKTRRHRSKRYKR